MNSFELNKIALALLLTVLVIFGIGSLTDVIFEEQQLASHSYPVEMEAEATEMEVEAPVATADVEAEEQEPSLGHLLAAASVEAGEKVFKKCKACHTTDNGGKNLVGPNLWNVVGRTIGGVDGFAYSDGMKEKGGVWTYEKLDAFLKKPGDFVNKTKMSFAGLKKAEDRADVIVLLRSLSDAPLDLPAAAEEETEEAAPEAAAADEETTAEQ